jgi:hypothetical protein
MDTRLCCGKCKAAFTTCEHAECGSGGWIHISCEDAGHSNGCGQCIEKCSGSPSRRVCTECYYAADSMGDGWGDHYTHRAESGFAQ